ncbi:sigma-G inhibitor, Gin [Thermincola ferriacetica]|uniref:Sigma-G inhibitor, Gin n=1 Tax=Thermincola ferriacetica TaxID=281456 RepID=A0A0L6W0W7_9FIRM|nr:sigma factor G inhibitor Gin [Thermincola ferriacetica]KNZ69175.1 sigma-G inhibitor, Gin [Thermincola ferriacetica]
MYRPGYNCFICGKVIDIPETATLTILGKHICYECEKAIVNLTMANRNYDFFKERIKRIIYN